MLCGAYLCGRFRTGDLTVWLRFGNNLVELWTNHKAMLKVMHVLQNVTYFYISISFWWLNWVVRQYQTFVEQSCPRCYDMQ